MTGPAPYPLTDHLPSLWDRWRAQQSAMPTPLPRLTDAAVELHALTGASGWCLAMGRLEAAAADVLRAREQDGHGARLDAALRHLADVLLDTETAEERARRVTAALERRGLGRAGGGA